MNTEILKSIGDGASFITVGSVLIGYLPAGAALLTIFWIGIRIYEAFTRRSHCINFIDGCPVICPPICRHYLSKKTQK